MEIMIYVIENIREKCTVIFETYIKNNTMFTIAIDFAVYVC